MRLNDIEAEIRPRQPWEDMDLGVILARRSLGRILRTWLVTFLPVCLVVLLVLGESLFWSLVCIAWLKPLYDRIIVFHLGRSLFGARPTARATWASMWTIMRRQFLDFLLWKRLTTYRSVLFPVLVLEQVDRRTYATRSKILKEYAENRAFGAMGASLLAELAICLGLLFGVWMMIPEGMAPDVSEIFLDAALVRDFQIPATLRWFIQIAYILAVGIIEPIYIGAGFGVYLNCRTHLEGWDIELMFRRMSERLSSVPNITAALILVGASLMWGSPASAAIEAPPGAMDRCAAEQRVETEAAMSDETPEQMVDRILAHEDFKRRKVKQYVPRGRPTSAAAGDFSVLRVFIWVLIITGVVLLIYWLVRNARLSGPPSNQLGQPGTTRRKAEFVVGMDVRPESLPEDIVATAKRAWAEGSSIAAMSLLYRGAISRLIHRFDVPIHESDTEHDCLSRVWQQREAPAGFMSSLVEAWVALRYGDQRTDDARFASLCESWPFDGAAR